MSVQPKDAEYEGDWGSDDLFDEVGSLLLRSADLDEVLTAVARGVCRITGLRRCLIVDYSAATGEAVGRAGHGVEQSAVSSVRVQVDDASLAESVLNSDRPMVVSDPRGEESVPEEYLDLFDVGGPLGAVGVRTEERGPIAVALFDDGGAPFSLDDRQNDTLARYADLAALAIQHSELLDQSRRLAAVLERSRLAAELHDGVTQDLYVAALELDEVLGDGALDGAQRERIESALSAVRNGGRQIRRALIELVDESAPEPDGFEREVRALLGDLVDRSGVVGELRVHGAGPDLGGDALGLARRVVAEGLRNVEKHADATEVEVSVRRGPEWWVVEVDDDGVGDPRAIRRDARGPHLDGGFGLHSIAAEADRLGGRAYVGRAARLRGISLSLALPVPTVATTSSNGTV